MEARIARLESDVAHMRSDIADIKLDLRGLRDKFDDVGSQLKPRIGSSISQLNEKADGPVAQLSANLDSLLDSIASAKIWGLTLYIAFAAVMLGTLARGFGWI